MSFRACQQRLCTRTSGDRGVSKTKCNIVGERRGCCLRQRVRPSHRSDLACTSHHITPLLHPCTSLLPPSQASVFGDREAKSGASALCERLEKGESAHFLRVSREERKGNFAAAVSLEILLLLSGADALFDREDERTSSTKKTRWQLIRLWLWA